MGLKTNLAKSAANATKQYMSFDRMPHFIDESKLLFSRYRAIFNSYLAKISVWRLE